jgi:hypothetical protein
VVFVASASGETLPPRWHDYSSNAVFSALLFPATNPSHRYVGQTDEPPIDPRIVARFSDLKRQWKESAARLHSGSEMFLHPAYQMIIGMGKQVLPLILRDLERDLDHWFWALKAITGADPCTDDMRGNLSAMRTTWLDWASKQGFRW